MKVLCACAEGNNRAVTFAHIIKYVPGFETMTVGLEYNTPLTCEMMFMWADAIVIVEPWMARLIPKKYQEKVRLYDIGPDRYPRPFNPELYARIKTALEKERIA